MKHTFIKVIVLTASISLVSCTSNTQKENTMVGAGSGAILGGLAASTVGHGTGAIGAGAAVGALVGGVIGHHMDSTDHAYVSRSVRSGQTTAWRNTQTKKSYKVTPTKHLIMIDGHPDCRHFATTVTTEGHTTTVHSTACRQADGTWVTLSPQ